MTVWANDLRRQSRIGGIVLWAAAGAIMLTLHIGALAWALREPPMVVADSPPPAIMIELAPTPEAVVTEDTNIATEETVSENIQSETVEPVKEPVPDVTPDLVEVEEEVTPEDVDPEPPVEQPPEAEPDEPVEADDSIEEQITAELENVEIPLPMARPKPPEKTTVRKEATKKKPEKPKRQKPAPMSRQTDKAKANVTASNRNAARTSSRGAGSSMSPAQWQSRLMARLERFKRYPSGARARGETGIAYVRFRIDDAGRVISVSLAKSSGFSELDAEVVALVRRASPLPAPPPGVNKTITAPVRFSVR